jgi:hypothetical protein
VASEEVAMTNNGLIRLARGALHTMLLLALVATSLPASAGNWGARREFREGMREIARERREMRREVRREVRQGDNSRASILTTVATISGPPAGLPPNCAMMNSVCGVGPLAQSEVFQRWMSMSKLMAPVPSGPWLTATFWRSRAVIRAEWNPPGEVGRLWRRADAYHWARCRGAGAGGAKAERRDEFVGRPARDAAEGGAGGGDCGRRRDFQVRIATPRKRPDGHRRR